MEVLTPEFGAKTFAKICMKMKEIGLRNGVASLASPCHAKVVKVSKLHSQVFP